MVGTNIPKNTFVSYFHPKQWTPYEGETKSQKSRDKSIFWNVCTDQKREKQSKQSNLVGTNIPKNTFVPTFLIRCILSI